MGKKLYWFLVNENVSSQRKRLFFRGKLREPLKDDMM